MPFITKEKTELVGAAEQNSIDEAIRESSIQKLEDLRKRSAYAAVRLLFNVGALLGLVACVIRLAVGLKTGEDLNVCLWPFAVLGGWILFRWVLFALLDIADVQLRSLGEIPK